MSLEKKTFERQRRFLVSARVGRTWKNSKFLERQRTYLNLGPNKENRVLRSKVANIIEKLVVEGSKWAIHTIPKKWHSDDSVNADAEVPIEDLESKQLMPHKDKNR
uniref:DUF4806 domain-containing protein n=1 Tax=Bursaphelenchus xylophilus TaxID=6326 RepID=A0A1I7RJF7_BURXY